MNLQAELVEKSTHLKISEKTIRQVAQKRFAGSSLAGIVVRQAASEIGTRLAGVNFRKRDNREAVQAYGAMTSQQFEGINARQQWANWRTIPRNLDGAIPNNPIFVIDLCCGIGHSTEVLAYYLPSGSRILGLEYSPKLVEQASTRSFRHMDESPAKASFRAQSALETYCDESGKPLEAGSVDLVNCCGAVGVHFDPQTTAVLAKEVARVLKPGGIAMIDSGPYGTSPEDLTQIFLGLGFEKVHSARSCFVDPYTQICFKKINKS